MTATDESGNQTGMLLLQLSIGRFGSTKRGDVSRVETDADRSRLKLSKHLLRSDELQSIVRLDQDIAAWIRLRTLPSYFRSGIYNIIPEYAEAIHEHLEAKCAERNELIETLCGQLAWIQSVDEQRLGSQFRADDYPTADVLRQKFTMEWRFFTMGAPEDLMAISPGLFAREKERVANLIEAAREQGVQLLREGFAGLVDHLVDKLSPRADGKRKRFYETNVSNLLEFLDTFKMRDIGTDTELAALVDKSKALLSGVTAEQVRDDDGFATRLREGFESVKRAVDPLVADAPTRKLDPSLFT